MGDHSGTGGGRGQGIGHRVWAMGCGVQASGIVHRASGTASSAAQPATGRPRHAGRTEGQWHEGTADAGRKVCFGRGARLRSVMPPIPSPCNICAGGGPSHLGNQQWCPRNSCAWPLLLSAESHARMNMPSSDFAIWPRATRLPYMRQPEFEGRTTNTGSLPRIWFDLPGSDPPYPRCRARIHSCHVSNQGTSAQSKGSNHG